MVTTRESTQTSRSRRSNQRCSSCPTAVVRTYSRTTHRSLPMSIPSCPLRDPDKDICDGRRWCFTQTQRRRSSACGPRTRAHTDKHKVSVCFGFSFSRWLHWVLGWRAFGSCCRNGKRQDRSTNTTSIILLEFENERDNQRQKIPSVWLVVIRGFAVDVLWQK